IPTSAAYAAALRQCADLGALQEGRRIHAHIASHGLDRDTFLGNTLVQMYGACSSARDALQALERIRERNVYSWTIMVKAYAQSGHLEDARRTFDQMPAWNASVVTWTVMVSGYAQHGCLDEAAALFESMPNKDAPTSSWAWNALIAGFGELGDLQSARRLFEAMPVRDIASWNSIITGYAENGCLDDAKSLFDAAEEQNIVSWNSMIRAYSRNAEVERARGVFDRMPGRDTVSWNVMIAAYLQHGSLDPAKDLFDLSPQRDTVTETAMVYGYAQAGHLAVSSAIFESMKEKDSVAWNVMIVAYAQNGFLAEAAELFQSMQLHGIKPNSVTYLNILCACSYAGLVIDACCYLRSSIGDYWIAPKMDHFVCLVDILGRAGMIAEAEEALRGMPYEADSIAWLTMLAACKNHGESRRGTAAAAAIHELEPGAAALYLLSSN
ncbi:hypothetical protein SELMODRAFT_31893, partial [Selaginella moellendorffii]